MSVDRFKILKLSLLVAFLFISTSVFGQEQLTVFYYGSTDCGPCNRPEVIQSINKLKADFASTHKKFTTKFVMVVMDETIPRGLNYIEKYEYWDEVAIGSRYHNELALANLNKTKIPGLPHIFVYKETFKDAGHGIELKENRNLAKEVLGGDQIVTWVNSGMKLE